jgi:uroporphyrinogen decarboxylase
MWRDEFGILWNRTIDPDIGTPEGILPEPTIRGYRFPDPDEPQRFVHVQPFIDANADKFIAFGVSFSLFERAWTLRGMPELLTDMVDHPDFVDDLLDAITEWNMAIVAQALQYGIDAVMFGDDWGCQRGLIMGAKHWRRFLKPRLERMYGQVKAADKRVFIHSCGDVKELFPELIEIGLDCFNPLQPEVMDVFEMKRRYHGRLAFYGGISVQKTLPYGRPDDVRREVRRLLKEVGAGGGYIAAPSHSIPKDVPVENILAMLEVLQNQ